MTAFCSATKAITKKVENGIFQTDQVHVSKTGSFLSVQYFESKNFVLSQ